MLMKIWHLHPFKQQHQSVVETEILNRVVFICVIYLVLILHKQLK